jgi:hypothetical protein
MTTDPYRSSFSNREPFRISPTTVRRAIGFFCLAILAYLPVLALGERERCSTFARELLVWGGVAVVFLSFVLFVINTTWSHRAHVADIVGLIAALPVGTFCVLLTAINMTSKIDICGHVL